MSPLQHLHTFQLPAFCQSVKSLSDLEQAKQFAKELSTEPFLLLGGGSNCAFIEDFEGHIVRVELKGIQVEERDDGFCLTVGAGENWHQLVSWTLENGMPGLENLALIPGTVGAAPIQNIGAYGSEVSQFIQYVDYIELGTARECRLSNQECQFGYRESLFKGALKRKALITQVHFFLPKKWSPNLGYAELKSLISPSPHTIFDTVIQVRQKKLPDPAVKGNAGSFFKNPIVSQLVLEEIKQSYTDVPYFELADGKVKLPAAWLIDKLGYKGKRNGGIMCHAKQPLVLMNNDVKEATGLQLYELASEIKLKVAEEFKIQLEPEVQLIGRKGQINL